MSCEHIVDISDGPCGCEEIHEPKANTSADERAREIYDSLETAWADGDMTPPHLQQSMTKEDIDRIAAALKEADAEGFARGDSQGFKRGVRECMAISDGQAPVNYPADKISGCKYYVTEKMLALIDPSISKTIEEWEKQFKHRAGGSNGQ